MLQSTELGSAIPVPIPTLLEAALYSLSPILSIYCICIYISRALCNSISIRVCSALRLYCTGSNTIFGHHTHTLHVLFQSLATDNMERTLSSSHRWFISLYFCCFHVCSAMSCGWQVCYNVTYEAVMVSVHTASTVGIAVCVHGTFSVISVLKICRFIVSLAYYYTQCFYRCGSFSMEHCVRICDST